MEWSTSCVDWERRLIARESIIPAPIFPDQAAQALAIFKELKVVDLPGKPTFGQCSEQWVFDFVAAIFGGYDAETGKQLIREYGLLISKKNTKSTIAAGIMLTALILCWREEEEHLILAPTKEVADNSFKPAAAMIREDEELSELFQIQDHIRTITHRVYRNTLKVVAADTDTVSGKKAGKILVDELWLFGKRANAAAMFIEALGGQVSRDEGWVIYLTTQSDEAPAGVFKDRLDYWRDVRDGKILDRKTLGILYEFPKAMLESKAYMDPANFYITNPNIGRSVSAEWLEDQLRKNREKKDGTFQQFLAKHLDVEIGLSLRADRWAGAEFWSDGARKGLTLEKIIQRSDLIIVGLDGGGLDDMLGMAVLGRDADSGSWLHWGKAWVHPIALERRKSEAPRWRDFEVSGDLVIVKAIGEDVDDVVETVERIWKTGKLYRIGVDPVGIASIVKALKDQDIELDDEGNEVIVGVSQGWRLSGTIKDVERRLPQGTLEHCGSTLMDYAVGNAKVEQRGNAALVTKAASGVAKIDPLIALFNAAALMAVAPEPETCSDEEVLAA